LRLAKWRRRPRDFGGWRWSDADGRSLLSGEGLCVGVEAVEAPLGDGLALPIVRMEKAFFEICDLGFNSFLKNPRVPRGLPQRLKPVLENRLVIVAVNRCATQNQKQVAFRESPIEIGTGAHFVKAVLTDDGVEVFGLRVLLLGLHNP